MRLNIEVFNNFLFLFSFLIVFQMGVEVILRSKISL